MKILVIGGSYFLGGVFTLLASKEHELTLINRGTYSMKRYGVREYNADRKNVQLLRSIPKDYYDVVIDFCAYDLGDIQTILENVKGFPVLTKKYIFISTVDVYERNVGYVKDENTPISTTRYGGGNGEYIYKKICLEKELKDVCSKEGIDYTIIRPSIIYGPNDYTQRVEAFIKMASNEIPILYPQNAKAKFQMVYVKDVVEAILAACKKSVSHEYNLCSNEPIGYEDFVMALTKVADVPVKIEAISMEEAIKKSIAATSIDEILQESRKGKVYLPFPITEEENEIYCGTKAEKELDIKYTSLVEGMKKTYNCFK